MGSSKKIFYGWTVVLGSIILMALGIGMFTSTNSVFVKPVCQSLGFARGQFTFYRTIVTLTSALLMPFFGKLIQRIGVKKLLFAGALMLGLVNIGYSFSTKLWHFYVLAFVNGAFVNGISFMSIGVLISAWFKGKKGLATGLAYSGSGLGGAIMIPAAANIIELAGWQWAYRFMGCLGIIILFPVIAVFIRNDPDELGLEPLPAEEEERRNKTDIIHNLTFQQAIGCRKFWMLTAAVFFISLFASSTNTHSAPYLSDLGYPTAFVSSVIALFMFFLTIGKIILGSVYDRFGTLAGNTVVSVFALGFPVFALLSHIPVMPWIYAVFLGMASCGVSVPVS
ncbi:MFS transporter, partial [Treponema sp. OttesenSCG-928-L16]|nr:MFS transporter [Treponema sp. OttesenSCG-928-L16]